MRVAGRPAGCLRLLHRAGGKPRRLRLQLDLGQDVAKESATPVRQPRWPAAAALGLGVTRHTEHQGIV